MIKKLFSKSREDMDGGPSIVFTRKNVVDETHIGKSGNVRRWFLGIDARQLYPHSMCQPMSTGVYTCFEYNADLQRVTPHQERS